MGICRKCERRWQGEAECHCSGCHKHFSSVSSFDKHQAGSGKWKKCLDTEGMKVIGMVFIEERQLWIKESMKEGVGLALRQRV